MAGDKLEKQPLLPQRYRRRARTRVLALVLASIACISSAIFLSDRVHRSLAAFATISPRPAPARLERPDDRNDNIMAIVTNEIMPTTATKPGHPRRTYPQLSVLPDSLLPKAPSDQQEATRRLIVIGDVHGHLDALKALLRKAEFSTSRGDTVVFTGDMVNKGPDSAGVVGFAMEIGAYAVRGNHEDRVMEAWERYISKRRAKQNGVDDDDDDDEDDHAPSEIDEAETEELDEEKGANTPRSATDNDEQDDDAPKVAFQPHARESLLLDAAVVHGAKSRGKKSRAADLATAKSLTSAHRKWINALPLILRIGDLGPQYGEDVLVVHAGLVPGIALESQDAEAVMNMRTLLPARSRSSIEEEEEEAGQNEQQKDETETDKRKRENKKGRKKPKDAPPMIPSASRDGKPWAAVWSSAQTSSSSSAPRDNHATTVIYGHDAKSGVQLRDYAFGIDSGCGQDQKLTGIIFEFTPAAKSARAGEEDGYGDILDTGKKNKNKPRVRHRLVSVSCADVS